MPPLELFLDLDSTLIYSMFSDIEKIEAILLDPACSSLKDRIKHCILVDSQDKSPKGMGDLEEFMLVLRPHVREFVKYISEHVDVIHIWSAGHFRYVRAVEAILFPPGGHASINYPQRVFTREHCEIGKDYVLKDLSLVCDDLSRVLIIDDRIDTFANNPQNAIHIPIYEPRPRKDELMKDDTCLLKIIDWFEKSGVLTCPDVRQIPKDRIFD